MKKILLFVTISNIISCDITFISKPLNISDALKILKTACNFEYVIKNDLYLDKKFNITGNSIDEILNKIIRDQKNINFEKNNNEYYFTNKNKNKNTINLIPAPCLDKQLKSSIKKFWEFLIKDKADKNKKEIVFHHEIQSLTIKATESEVKKVKNFLIQTQSELIKVKIDIVLIATEKEFDWATGINWGGIYNRLKTVQKEGKNFDFVKIGELILPPDFNFPTLNITTFTGPIAEDFGSVTPDVDAGAFAQPTPIFKLPIIFGGPDLNVRRLDIILNANDVEKNIKIVSRLTTMVNDNKVAKFNVSQSLPFLNYKQQTVKSAQNLRNTNTIDYKDIGISTQVKPYVIDKNYITLDFYAEFAEIVSGSTQANFRGIMPDPPKILFGKIKDKIHIENGQTIIVGGLSNMINRKEFIAVPYINQIPGGKMLFASRGKKKRLRNDYLLLTATIIK